MHKFALYYTTNKVSQRSRYGTHSIKQISKQLDYEALEEYDTHVNKKGERARLSSDVTVIPLTDIVDARVSKIGILN